LAALSLTVLSATACTGSSTTPGDKPVDDTATPADPPWYVDATLEPAFQQAHAVWAGTAILDYDNDGWLDIFFTNGTNHADALYHNNGDGTFSDVAQRAGLTHTASTDGSAMAADLDNDGDEDLVLAGACLTGTYELNGASKDDGTLSFLRNNGDGTFSAYDGLVSPKLKSDYAILCHTGMTAADVDNDGFTDIVLMNSDDPDQAVPYGFRKGSGANASVVMYNDGTGSFDVHSQTVHDPRVHVTSFVATVFDVDGDALPDVMMGQGGWYMQVFNHGDDGPRTMTWAPERSDSGDGLWMGLAAADYDGDGDFDIYGTNQGLSMLVAGFDNFSDLALEDGEWVNIYHSMLENDGGVFRPMDWPMESDRVLAGDIFQGLDGQLLDRVGPQGLDRLAWGWGVVALDADGDGWSDVAYVGNNCSPPVDIIWTVENGAGPGALLLNQQGHGFLDVSEQAGVVNSDDQGRFLDGRGLAVGDLNNDGYDDLVIVNRDYNTSETSALTEVTGKPRVLLSTPRTNHWLQLKLVGTTSARDAIGSVVKVSWGGMQHSYLYSVGGATSSSSARMISIGVGDADQVDLEVDFPSGTVTTMSGVDVNQRLTIEETR